MDLKKLIEDKANAKAAIESKRKQMVSDTANRERASKEPLDRAMSIIASVVNTGRDQLVAAGKFAKVDHEPGESVLADGSTLTHFKKITFGFAEGAKDRWHKITFDAQPATSSVEIEYTLGIISASDGGHGRLPANDVSTEVIEKLVFDAVNAGFPD